jgi:Tfp pilus assembly protein PilW
MTFRGQSALDLLLGLLILLIVLNIFSGVMSRYEDVQKEISIRQQLRDNLSVMSLLTGYAAGFFYDIRDHPATNSLPQGHLLYSRTDIFTRSTGIVALDPVRGVDVPSPFLCSLFIDINGAAYFGVSAYPADTGLSYTVDTSSVAALKYLFDENHTFNPAGCFDYFSIEGLP